MGINPTKLHPILVCQHIVGQGDKRQYSAVGSSTSMVSRSHQQYQNIFIRSVYMDLYNLIKDMNEQMILTGTPGIGKSVLAMYMLYKELKCGKT